MDIIESTTRAPGIPQPQRDSLEAEARRLVAKLMTEQTVEVRAALSGSSLAPKFLETLLCLAVLSGAQMMLRRMR